MGEFLAVSAFRTRDADGVLAAAETFFVSRNCSVERIGPAAQGNDDLQIFHPVDGWTVALWPNWFTGTAVAQAISADQCCLASDIDVYDGDFWGHRLIRDGEVLDRFCSIPDYVTEDPVEAADLVERYKGRPDLIAVEVGRSVEQVAPYLVRTILDEDGDEVSPVGKAFPDDDSELADPDVLFDFWRRFSRRSPSVARDLRAGAVT